MEGEKWINRYMVSWCYLGPSVRHRGWKHQQFGAIDDEAALRMLADWQKSNKYEMFLSKHAFEHGKGVWLPVYGKGEGDHD